MQSNHLNFIQTINWLNKFKYTYNAPFRDIFSKCIKCNYSNQLNKPIIIYLN